MDGKPRQPNWRYIGCRTAPNKRVSVSVSANARDRSIGWWDEAYPHWQKISLRLCEKYQSINQFSGLAYPWGVAGAAARVGSSKHLDPLQQRINALLGCQGETN